MGPPALLRAAREIDRHQPFRATRSGAASPKRWGERKSVLVDTSPGGECSIDSTYHVDMPKSTIASRGGTGLRAQWVEPHEDFRRVRGCTRKSIVIDDRRRGGRRRLTRWRGARAGHHLRDVIGLAIRPNCALAKTKASVCRRAREVPSGRLLVDSPSDWDHNLGLRAQSRPLRMMPTLRTLATALCLLGLVATGIVGGSGLGPTAAQARPTPP
jgi:hypothetical protein